MEYASFFQTGLGRGVVVASERGVSRVILPGVKVEELFVREGLGDLRSSERTVRVAGMLMHYFKGKRQPFDSVEIDLHVTGRFRRRILEFIRSIPYGEVMSYGEVASAAGAPKAARAVGGAMASNPLPVIIPCHRVVAGNGRLTGFSAEGGLAVKKQLLEMEGVEFNGERARRTIVGYKQANLA
jgi:methylated-DNA-[protein]-cysteine S-methyltransferase